MPPGRPRKHRAPQPLPANEWVWLGGVLSAVGEIKVSHKSKPQMQVLISSTKHPRMVEQACQIVDEPPRLIGGRLMMVLKGEKADSVIGLVWDYLTDARQLEYNTAVKLQRLRMDEYVARKRAKEEDRQYYMGKPVVTKEDRRRTAEERYDNSDPAVEVLPDEDPFLTPDMVSPDDLAAAAAYRQQNHDLMTQGLKPADPQIDIRRKRKKK